MRRSVDPRSLYGWMGCLVADEALHPGAVAAPASIELRLVVLLGVGLSAKAQRDPAGRTAQ
jgi:hypothetical protein